MPRYFFNAREGAEVTRDETGVELTDLSAARKVAVRALTERAEDILPDDGSHKDMVIEVTNEAGEPLFEASLKFRLTLD